MSKKMKIILFLFAVVGCVLFAVLYCLGNNVSLISLSDLDFNLLLLGIIVGFVLLNFIVVICFFYSDGNEVYS